MSITKDRAHHWGIGVPSWDCPVQYVEDFSAIPLEYAGTMISMMPGQETMRGSLDCQGEAVETTGMARQDVSKTGLVGSSGGMGLT